MLEHQLLTSNQLQRKFPYLTIGEGNDCVLQISKCGLVNPRKNVLAQKTAAHLRGCHIIDGIVDQMWEKRKESGDKILELVTEDGRIIQSRKVLLCTGGFTLSKPLLPIYLLPDIRLAPNQTLRLELDADNEKIMEGMPMMASLTREDDVTDCYVCPPVRYPNGKRMIPKMSPPLFKDSYLQTFISSLFWYQYIVTFNTSLNK